MCVKKKPGFSLSSLLTGEKAVARDADAAWSIPTYPVFLFLPWALWTKANACPKPPTFWNLLEAWQKMIPINGCLGRGEEGTH